MCGSGCGLKSIFNSLKITAFIGLLIGQLSSASAQTYVLDHSSSYSPAWAPGNLTRTATNIGGSGINCTTTASNSGGAFVGPNGTAVGATPTVTTSIFTVGGSTANLEVCLDFTTNTQSADVVYQFSSMINNVTFNIADIDKVNPGNNSYFDRVTVTGFDGTTTFNATLTKYTPASNFVVIAGNVANANTTNGQGGDSNSDATDQNATVIVSFGTTAINRVTIHFDNAPGANANPGAQSIGIGNISFQKVGSLPLTLTSFTGSARQNDIQLNWTTESELNFRSFTIERSATGSNFANLGEVESKVGGGRKLYSFTDLNAGQKSETFYYRLRMNDKDGSFTYSPIISVKFKSPLKMTLSMTPNPVTDRAFVHIRSDINGTAQLSCYNASGQTIFRRSEKLTQGENVFNIDFNKNLVAGWYVLQLSVGDRILTSNFAVAR